MRQYEYTKTGARLLIPEGAHRALILIAVPLTGYIAGGTDGLVPNKKLSKLTERLTRYYEGFIFYLTQTRMFGTGFQVYAEANSSASAFAKLIVPEKKALTHPCLGSHEVEAEIKKRNAEHPKLKMPSILDSIRRQSSELLRGWVVTLHDLARTSEPIRITVAITREPLPSAYATALGHDIEQVGLMGGQAFVVFYDIKGTPIAPSVQRFDPPEVQSSVKEEKPPANMERPPKKKEAVGEEADDEET